MGNENQETESFRKPEKFNLYEKFDKAFREVFREFAKFGVVGLCALVIDIGLFNIILLYFHTNAIVAKVVSTTTAVVFAYFGNKFWSFRTHHNFTIKHVFTRNHRKHHTKEFTQFVAVNFVALSFSLIALYISNNILGFTSLLADNIAGNVIGLGVGTLFRFYAYRTWLFKDPKTQPEENLTPEALQP